MRAKALLRRALAAIDENARATVNAKMASQNGADPARCCSSWVLFMPRHPQR